MRDYNYSVTVCKNHNLNQTVDLSQRTAWNIFQRYCADPNVNFATFRHNEDVLYYFQCEGCSRQMTTKHVDLANLHTVVTDRYQIFCTDCAYPQDVNSDLVQHNA